MNLRFSFTLVSTVWCLIFVVVDGTVKEMENNPIVTVKEGKLKGTVEKLLDGSNYYSFKGIPYAKPPIGDLRFTDPKPPLPWNGIYDATKHGPVCTQYDISLQKFVEGSEDCLFLNIYTKSLKRNSKTPVMVFIHGGGFMSGSGDYDNGFGPEFLLQHDVILVTMNYRLEVLGFLNLETAEVPGNAAMKDQVAALQWVKKNIKQFGGNPDSVTLFGESSGSASVIHHMQSPMSKGLFHKAIAQSGDNLVEWAFGEESVTSAFRVAKLLGKETNDTTEVLKFLRSVPAIKLARLRLDSMTEAEKKKDLSAQFIPVAEKRFDNVVPFLTDKPLDVLLNKKMNDVPLMMGYNSAESLYMINEQLKRIDSINNNPQYIVPKEITDIVTVDKTKEFGERLVKFYAGDGGFTTEKAQALVDLISDFYFVYSIHRFVHFYSSLHESVYMYRFNLVTDLNILKILSGLSHMQGASHADELFYLFYNKFNKKPYEEKDELKDIVFNLTKLWADFAKTGNPTPSCSSVIWPAYNNVTRDYLDINVNYTPGQFAEKERVELWDKMYCEVGLPCITE